MGRPRKRFGQHFLEPAWIDKVIRVIAPQGDQVFLEIGPGRGALTRELAARSRFVLACEIDRDLVAALRAAEIPRLAVIEGDVLDVTAARASEALTEAGCGGVPIRVAGNLPYNVASPILFRLADLFAAGLPVVDVTVMLQREVADRLTALPGTRDYGVLTILLGQVASAERVLALPPGAFRPMPKVQSAVVRMRFHPPDPRAMDLPLFAEMVQAIFTRRRKTLANALAAFPLTGQRPPAEVLSRTGLDGTRRPETLSIAELVRLADAFVT